LSIAAIATAAGLRIGDDAEWFAPRTPFKPLRIDQIAAETPQTSDSGNDGRPSDV
jgi:hypothetical protein